MRMDYYSTSRFCGRIGRSPGCKLMTLNRFVLLVAASLFLARPATAQQLRFDDVVRNLRNPDPKARLSAVRLLRDAKYPESIAPMAPLVVDPVDDIQLEAIAAELTFFLTEEVKAHRMIGFVVERRNPAVASAAFDLGPAALWPRRVPPALVSSLLQAIDDENARVRLEATYALGVIARPPMSRDDEGRLVKALDHYDPAVRAAAARVIGRLNVTAAADTLMKAVNDSNADVRYAAMRALGSIKDTRAVQTLTEQFAYYRKGEGAWAALDALAHLAQPASAGLFKERLADKDPFLRRAAAEGLGRIGDTSSTDELVRNATADESEMVRAAMAFALAKLGRNYVTRIVDTMDSPKMLSQAQDYLVELGPAILKDLYPRLQESDPAVRGGVAEVLGIIGGEDALPALQAVAQDRDPGAATAAKRAIERIKAAR
jgi:HEAT repeat protein